MLRRRNDFQEKIQRLKNDLLNEILSGRIQPEEFILPENSLSEKYELSRVSVRKVLAELVEEGLIEKIPGKGNKVIQSTKNIQRQTLRLAWFSSSYEIETVRKILRRFEQSQPYIDVELIVLPEEGYSDSLIQMMEQGQGPDVFMMSDLHVRQFASKDKTGLLFPFIPEKLNPQEDSYPEVFELFTIQGTTIATPFIFSPVVICYNERLFQEAGIDGNKPIQDWDELLRVAECCTVGLDHSGVTEQYGFCFSASANRWPVFALQNGGTIINEAGEWTLSDPATQEALQFCLDLIYKHKVAPIYTHGSTDLAERLFMKERVAMILTTYYFMNEFRDHSIAWGVCPISSGENSSTLLLGGGLAINEASPNLLMAQRLVAYMVSEEAQTLIKQHGCTIPMLKRVAEDDSLLNPAIHPKHYNTFLQMLPHAKSLLSLGVKQQEMLAVMDELHLLWANMESPQDACARIDQFMKDRQAKS